MTDIGKTQMEEWKKSKKRLVVYSQGGEKKFGQLIDYNDREIVLKNMYACKDSLTILHDWFLIEEYHPDSGSC